MRYGVKLKYINNIDIDIIGVYMPIVNCFKGGFFGQRKTGFAFKRSPKVGACGFEPQTSRTRTVRATKLRYAPYLSGIIPKFSGLASEDSAVLPPFRSPPVGGKGRRESRFGSTVDPW